MIKAFLFDMDGTLADSESHYVGGTFSYFKEHGYKGSFKDVSCIMGLNMDQTYKFISKSLNVSYEKAKELNDTYFKEHPLRYKDYIFGETKEILEYLHNNGYKLALCSSNDIDSINNFLDLGYRKYFDLVINPKEITNNKPDPEIYLKAIEKLGINKDEAVVVEDSYNGILAGVNSGIYTIAKENKKFGTDQTKANKIVKSLLELKNYY